MGEAIARNDDRVLWDEVRKMTKSTNELPSMMDGHTGIDEISKVLADKCETLYNSVSYDNHDMDNLKKGIDSHIEKCVQMVLYSKIIHILLPSKN